MFGGRSKRLYCQALGCGEALVAGACMDAQVTLPRDSVGREFDVEFKLLIDAIYQMYHYDFRGYAPASLRRRLKAAMTRFECRTLSQLQDRIVHDRSVF